MVFVILLFLDVAHSTKVSPVPFLISTSNMLVAVSIKYLFLFALLQLVSHDVSHVATP